MIEVSTSLLNANNEGIIKTIYNLEKAKTDYFHIDVMDGEFVEDNTNSKMLEFCEYLNSVTNVPIDVHLMVNDLKNYIDSYSIFNPNIITFHYEACKDKDEILKIINYIKSKEIKVGIAIKPDTPIDNIYEFLPIVHTILIMTVEPGKGGQKLIGTTIEKISKLKEYIKLNNIDIDIEADGGINVENSKQLIDAGVDIIVSGNGILNTDNFEETIRELKDK